MRILSLLAPLLLVILTIGEIYAQDDPIVMFRLHCKKENTINLYKPFDEKPPNSLHKFLCVAVAKKKHL